MYEARQDDEKYMLELAVKAVDNLGDHPEVALAEMGIRGVKGDPSNCPLANYLNQVLPLPDGHGWVVGSGYRGYGSARLSEAGGRFVAEFDAGDHPPVTDTDDPGLPPRLMKWKDDE